MLATLGIQAGVGLLSGLGNLFSSQSQADEINKRITRAQELAAKNLVTQDEIADRLHSIDRMFNQRLTSVLNTTALRSRGIANKGTVGAAVAGQVEGSRLEAQNTVIGQAKDVNREINMSIANLELQKGSADGLGAFVEGFASGVPLANEGLKMFDREIPSLPGKGAGQALNPGSLGPIPMAGAGSFNPFMQTNVPRMSNPYGGTQLKGMGLNISAPQTQFMSNVFGGF